MLEKEGNTIKLDNSLQPFAAGFFRGDAFTLYQK